MTADQKREDWLLAVYIQERRDGYRRPGNAMSPHSSFNANASYRRPEGEWRRDLGRTYWVSFNCPPRSA